MTISKYLSLCIESPNHDDLAKLWIDITKQKIICVNPEEQIFYKFDTEQMLYVKLFFQEFSELVKSDIRQYLNEIKAINTDKRLIDLIKKCGDKGYSDNISKTIASKIYNKEFLTNLDSDVNVINFKNGFVNLKTGDFSKRTEDDFFSICLDYDYSEEKNNKLITEIKDVLKKICNDDDTLLNFKLSWSGYCLTGHTTEQKSLWEIGYSASNGKSTFAKIFMKCFDKYCYKMNREALETGYSKIHKEISQTKGIRFVVIEELRRKKLNESLYKDLVDGDKLNNEVLYSTTEEIKIKFKLDIITNNDPNFNNDNGMVRRGILINFTNRFIDKEDYDRMKNKK
jgi:P4 family phage/plasmid primase-like protien